MKCRFCRADCDRIERLTRRARDQIRAANPACNDVPRAVIVRALLRQGFDLVATREIVGTYPSATEPPILVSYRISAVDSARLAQVCDLLKGRSLWLCFPKRGIWYSGRSQRTVPAASSSIRR